MKQITLLSILLISLSSSGQKFNTDTIAPMKGYLGFHFGFNYSNLQVDAGPFVFSDSLAPGSLKAVNGVGFAGGAFYEGRILMKNGFSLTSWRIGFQFELNTAFLEYDTRRKNKEEYDIHPVCVELPVQFAYYRKPISQDIPLELNSAKASSFAPMISIRPGIPLGFANSTHPEMNNFFLFGEVGVERSLRLKSTIMTVQLSYARDLISRLKGGSNDSYNTPINSMQKDLINFTLLFR
jgi:hypothetical protein